jgi:UDP-N-acetyl-D-mannosaminuronic acid dehydrogenase
MSEFDICVIGGCGHIGAPLAILLASKGFKVLIFDPNRNAWEAIKAGKLPFLENGHEPLLKQVLEKNNLFYSPYPEEIKTSKVLIITIGTPIDEFHNPKIFEITKCLDELPIHNEHLLILRSTLFPGTTSYVHKYLKDKGLEPLIAFCPERIVQGEAINELQKLPQIVSGITTEAALKADLLFSSIAPKIIHMNNPMEAEFAKLFANTYRYIQFAATNQFYEMVTSAGLDYNVVLQGAKQDYTRLAGLPGPGFAGGPCLLKDTLQLCAFAEGKFALGQAAMQANEGLPNFLINQLEKEYIEYGYTLNTKTVGLLGMAFKANSDDARTSLSYKLKKILKLKAKKVLTTDPLVKDKELLPLDDVIEQSDILILCVPHDQYKELDTKGKRLVNVWQ